MFRKIKSMNVIYGLILVLAGLILTFFPEITAKTIAYTFGVVAEIMGLFYIIRYFRSEPGFVGENRGLVSGLVIMMFGLLIFIKSEIVISIIPMILGFLVATSGLNTLQQGIDLARVNGRGWGVVILIAVVNIVIGVIALCNPFSTVAFLIRIIGIGMIYSGITDFIISLYLSNQIKKYHKQEEVIIDEEDVL